MDAAGKHRVFTVPDEWLEKPARVRSVENDEPPRFQRLGDHPPVETKIVPVPDTRGAAVAGPAPQSCWNTRGAAGPESVPFRQVDWTPLHR